MRKCSASLIIREMYIKTNNKILSHTCYNSYYQKDQRKNAGEDMEKSEHSYISVIVNCCRHYEKQYGDSPKN